MLVIDPTLTLAALVTEHPQLARRLDRLGIDYACGGDRTVAEVCADVGFEMARLVGAPIPATPEDRGWTILGPGALIDHLEVTHHATTALELPRLTALAERVAADEGTHHPELLDLEAALGVLRGDLEAHMAREEERLFPLVRHAERVHWDLVGARGLADLLVELRAEHLENGATLERVRRLTGDYDVPDGADERHASLVHGLSELEADLHLHVHKENNVLFPRIEERLRTSV